LPFCDAAKQNDLPDPIPHRPLQETSDESLQGQQLSAVNGTLGMERHPINDDGFGAGLSMHQNHPSERTA